MVERKINCYQCKYFYVTWDRNFPRGCKVFGFKGQQIPSLLVIQSSGRPCAAFIPKEEKKS